MNLTVKLRMAMIVIAIVGACGTMNAHHWHRRFVSTATFISRPIVTVRVRNHLPEKERFRMAMAYLKNHHHLTVKKYAQMTGMSGAAAQAELDLFAADKGKPIASVIRGKKKVYVIRNGYKG